MYLVELQFLHCFFLPMLINRLNPIPKELPYSLGHQLVTSASSLKPCACNQALMSSCCYNESLSDGEYKAAGEHASANHTYYTRRLLSLA